MPTTNIKSNTRGSIGNHSVEQQKVERKFVNECNEPEIEFTNSGEIPICGVIENDNIGINRRSERSTSKCPCCNRKPKQQGKHRLETLTNSSVYDGKSLIFESLSLLDNDNDSDDDDDDNSCISETTNIEGIRNLGKLDTNIQYETKRLLAEGWVHKKGTGKDWMGSTGWKPRYAKLVLANLPGYPDSNNVPVPLLLFYWFGMFSVESMPEKPSTSICLESSVVVPYDKEDKTDWDAYCIDIIHVNKTKKERDNYDSLSPSYGKSEQDENEEGVIKRTITVSTRKARDEWLYIISQALFNYEKQKAKVRQDAINAMRPRSPPARFLIGSAGDSNTTTDEYPAPPPPPPPPPSTTSCTKATKHTTMSSSDAIELEAHFDSLPTSNSSCINSNHKNRPTSPVPPLPPKRDVGTPPRSPKTRKGAKSPPIPGGISSKRSPS